MAAPLLSRLLGASPGGAAAPRPANPDAGARRWWLWLAALPVLALVAPAALVLVLLAGSVARHCDHGLPGAFAAPGTLGGVAGTGLTRAQIRLVRRGPHAGPALTPGPYTS